MIVRGLQHPEANKAAQDDFVCSFFGNTLDGRSGQRVAEALLRISKQSNHEK
jgi:hypothetical protein